MIKSILLIYSLPFFIVILFLLKKFSESTIKKISFLGLLIPFLATLFLIPNLIIHNNLPLEYDLYEWHILDHHFSFNFYFDKMSLVVLFLTGLLSLAIGKFSHTYLHREIGFQRFFRTICLFVFGLELLAIAGTLDLFFAAWEIIGLSSFLLIAFYRDRTRSIKNAFRIFCIYRFCDLGILFGALVGHLLFKQADHFRILLNTQDFLSYVSIGWINFLGFLILLASVGKSAQFPFHNWPARAMEGPTPSSAIFYGALSIHCGALLLLRTYNLWSISPLIQYSIISVGLLTIFFGTGIGRVQSNIKGQLAYASVVQIGFMYIEIALGWHDFFLFHMTAHCLLRCVQLLTSPSSVIDYVKLMNMGDSKTIKRSIEDILPLKIKTTLYSFGMQEGFLSPTLRGHFFFSAFTYRNFFKALIGTNYSGILFLTMALVLAWWQKHLTPMLIAAYCFASLDFFFSLRALFINQRLTRVWKYFIVSQLCFILSNYCFDPTRTTGIYVYLFNALPALIVGYLVLRKLPQVNLNKFNGLYSLYPKHALIFFSVFLVLACYPFSSTFFGEHFIFSEIFINAPVILFFTTLSMFFNGIVTLNIFVKTFWGHPAVAKY